MANPEHVERLKYQWHVIEFVDESSRFRQRMRQTEQQSARWARRKQDH